jgi:hypothetical protein
MPSKVVLHFPQMAIFLDVLDPALNQPSYFSDSDFQGLSTTTGNAATILLIFLQL